MCSKLCVSRLFHLFLSNSGFVSYLQPVILNKKLTRLRFYELQQDGEGYDYSKSFNSVPFSIGANISNHSITSSPSLAARVVLGKKVEVIE